MENNCNRSMFANGVNIFATDTIFANNTAVNSGGSIFMNSSSLGLIPGASVLFEIFGWDSFANRMFTNQFDIESNATAPVTFTSKASKLDKTAYVLPLFEIKDQLGKLVKG
eukprot:455149_1